MFANNFKQDDVNKNFRLAFEDYVGFTPYAFQEMVYKALANQRSVVLRAPTGSGKSEAVFMAYALLRSVPDFPKRLIHSLPLRTLADSLADRYQRYAKRIKQPMLIKAQHGARPESTLFYADVVVATIDQLVSSYASAPLSLSPRVGNIPAGAIPGSLLVFDEVQTLEPKLGLQSMLLMASRQQLFGVPFVIMTATLPTMFIEALTKELKFDFLDIEESDIKSRSIRKVTLAFNNQNTLTPKEVIRAKKEGHSKVLVVVNTVDRAIGLYQELKQLLPPSEPLFILHSRFLDGDRQVKQQIVQELFGKDGKEAAVLIATQVIEAGIDISADMLLTELCPADSLVQRVGRCARWGGDGHVIVYDVLGPAPYDSEILARTANNLSKINDSVLDWQKEKWLVDEVLGAIYADLTDIELRATALNHLAEAAFEGKPFKAEKAVRQIDTVDLTIHDDPSSATNDLLSLERISISPGILARLVKEYASHGTYPLLWSVEIDRNSRQIRDEYSSLFLKPVRSTSEAFQSQFFVISSQQATYDSETGLLIGVSGRALPKRKAEEKRPLVSETPERKDWQTHAFETVQAFREILLQKEWLPIKRIGNAFGISYENLIALLTMLLTCHDLGKMTTEWQKIAGAKEHEFIAKFSKSDVALKTSLPSHSTTSAFALWDFLQRKYGRRLGVVAALSLAHHHSVRAVIVPKYKLKKGWHDVIMATFKKAGVPCQFDSVIEETIEKTSGERELDRKMPDFSDSKAYSAYIIFSRVIRLSDWIASGGGEDAIYRFEERA